MLANCASQGSNDAVFFPFTGHVFLPSSMYLCAHYWVLNTSMLYHINEKCALTPNVLSGVGFA